MVAQDIMHLAARFFSFLLQPVDQPQYLRGILAAVYKIAVEYQMSFAKCPAVLLVHHAVGHQKAIKAVKVALNI
ncbi:hypothetical protein D9M72_478280 [compost metagenome]